MFINEMGVVLMKIKLGVFNLFLTVGGKVTDDFSLASVNGWHVRAGLGNR